MVPSCRAAHQRSAGTAAGQRQPPAVIPELIVLRVLRGAAPQERLFGRKLRVCGSQALPAPLPGAVVRRVHAYDLLRELQRTGAGLVRLNDGSKVRQRLGVVLSVVYCHDGSRIV